jgi:hypothetical protein
VPTGVRLVTVIVMTPFGEVDEIALVMVTVGPFRTDGVMVAVRVTVPVKLLNGLSVIVDVAGVVWPTTTISEEGVADRLKLGCPTWPKVKAADVPRMNWPLVPVMGTMKEPVRSEVQVREAVAVVVVVLRDTVLGVTDPQDRPEGAVAAKATIPVKPFWPATVIIEVPEDPGAIGPTLVAEME